MILDKPYEITKESIATITRLCNIEPVPVKKSIKSREVKALTWVTRDQRELIIHTIIDLVIRYVAYGISYKIYFRNREGSTSTIVVYVAH